MRPYSRVEDRCARAAPSSCPTRCRPATGCAPSSRSARRPTSYVRDDARHANLAEIADRRALRRRRRRTNAKAERSLFVARLGLGGRLERRALHATRERRERFAPARLGRAADEPASRRSITRSRATSPAAADCRIARSAPRDDLVAQLPAGRLHGGPDACRGHRAAGDRRAAAASCRPSSKRTRSTRNAERLGRDLRHHRVGAGADVLRARLHDDACRRAAARARRGRAPCGAPGTSRSPCPSRRACVRRASTGRAGLRRAQPKRSAACA